jgi:hypothetical protein
VYYSRKYTVCQGLRDFFGVLERIPAGIGVKLCGGKSALRVDLGLAVVDQIE